MLDGLYNLLTESTTWWFNQINATEFLIREDNAVQDFVLKFPDLRF